MGLLLALVLGGGELLGGRATKADPLPLCDADVHWQIQDGVKTYFRWRANEFEPCRLGPTHRLYVDAPECKGEFTKDAADSGYVMKTADGGVRRCKRVFR